MLKLKYNLISVIQSDVIKIFVNIWLIVITVTYKVILLIYPHDIHVIKNI